MTNDPGRGFRGSRSSGPSVDLTLCGLNYQCPRPSPVPETAPPTQHHHTCQSEDTRLIPYSYNSSLHLRLVYMDPSTTTDRAGPQRDRGDRKKKKKIGRAGSARTPASSLSHRPPGGGRPHLGLHAKSEEKKRVGGGKTTAPRIPMWSPTMVLTGRHSG